MSANDKAAAAYHPLDDQPADALVGENPCIPPFMDRALALAGPNARSGADAVFAAIAAKDDAIQHAMNLQGAINDIRTFIEGKHAVGAIEIRNLLESHHV